MTSNFPNKQVRIIVPLPRGGPADILARLIGEKLAQIWDREVIVDNPVGGDTIDGTSIVAKAAPDGHTLLIVPSQFTVHARQRKDLPYNVVKDFAPVILLALGPNVLVVHPTVAAVSIQRLIEIARTSPGSLSYATGGPGSTSHVAAERFKGLANLDIRAVHYQGAAPATEAILAGEVDMLFSVMAPTLPYVQEGSLRALAVTGPSRARLLPEVPTLKESGFPTFDVTTWQGLLAPAGTSPAIIASLNKDLGTILQMPDVQRVLAAKGFELTGSTPEEFSSRIKSEVAMNG